MRIRTGLLFVGGILGSMIMACGGDGPAGPPPPNVLRATSPTGPVQGVLGATLDPFEVQVTDHNGNPVSDVTLRAEATDGRLDDTSPVTDVNGRARTTLTLPDHPTSVTVAVTGPDLPEVRFEAEAVLSRPAKCTAVSQDSLALAPGEVVVRDALSEEACFFLRSGSGHRYRIGILRASFGEVPSDTSTVHLAVEAGAGVSAAPAAPAAPTARPSAAPARIPLAGPLLQALRVEEATEALHIRLRRQEEEIARRMPPGALLRDRRPAFRSDAGTVSRLTRTSSQTTAAPSRLDLDVSTTCDRPDRRAAILVGENSHLAFYQDSVEHASSPLDAGLVQSILDYYAAYGHGVIEEYFGGVPDVNGDGVVNVLATPAVPVGAAAFVWSGDFFSVADCASSNEMEIVYFSTLTIQDMSEGNWQALGTMVHEAKHVSSLYHRIRRVVGGIAPSEGLHPLYVEEGTAEIAAEVATRIGWAANGGPARTAPVRADDFDGVFDRWNFGIALRLARTVRYLSSQPNGVVVNPVGASSGHSVYGSGWHFHRWLGDAYGGAATTPSGDAALFREQNDSLTTAGRRGIQAVTGQAFLDLLEEWGAAVLLHGTGAPEPARRYATYDFPSAAEIFCSPDPLGVYPWPVTVTGTPSSCDENSPPETFQMAATLGSSTYSGKIGAAGLRVHDFAADGSGPGAEITVFAEVPARILVVRIQ